MAHVLQDRGETIEVRAYMHINKRQAFELLNQCNCYRLQGSICLTKDLPHQAAPTMTLKDDKVNAERTYSYSLRT